MDVHIHIHEKNLKYRATCTQHAELEANYIPSRDNFLNENNIHMAF